MINRGVWTTNCCLLAKNGSSINWKDVFANGGVKRLTSGLEKM